MISNPFNIYTSYFAKVMRHPSIISGELDPVSIAHSQPNGFALHTDLVFQPRIDMINDYKSGRLSETNYRFKYKCMLDSRITEELLSIAYRNTVFVCWEAPDKFCHRFVLAEWYHEKFGHYIQELRFEPEITQLSLPF